MATRGQIAYLADSNSVFSIYINFDAYPESLGKTLTTHFNSDDQAQNVVMDGYDIRGIDEDGTVERYDKGGAKQITDNEPADLFSELYDNADRSAANYVYVWIGDKWVTLDMNKGRKYFVGTLLDQTGNNEPTMEAYHVGGNKEVITKEDEDELNELFVRQMKYKAGIIK
jgi:hypothetical protein